MAVSGMLQMRCGECALAAAVCTESECRRLSMCVCVPVEMVFISLCLLALWRACGASEMTARCRSSRERRLALRSIE